MKPLSLILAFIVLLVPVLPFTEQFARESARLIYMFKFSKEYPDRVKQEAAVVRS